MSPDDIKLSLIDIHEVSLNAVERIVTGLGWQDFINQYICCDAVHYTHPKDDRIHLVVSENMRHALYGEGQVFVTHNFARQICPGGVLIPTCISIEANLIDPSKEFDVNHTRHTQGLSTVEKLASRRRDRMTLGTIFTLSLEHAATHERLMRKSSDGIDVIPAGKVTMPEHIERRYQLMLCTEITIYDDIMLLEYESGLTYPLMYALDTPLHRLREMQFFYRGGPMPGFASVWL